MRTRTGGYRRQRMGQRLLIGLVILCAPFAVAQIAEYGYEEVEAREQEEDVAQEGLSRRRADSAPAMMPGVSASIGSERTGGRRDASAATLLRYDQHRVIQPPDYATVRIGPFYSNLAVAQSAGFRHTWFSGAGTDFLEGNRRGDIKKGGTEFPLLSTLTLNNYLMITRRLDLEANISISYQHYPMNTQEDDLRISLTDEGIFATFSAQIMASRYSRMLVYDDILYQTDFIDTRGLTDRYGGRKYESLANTLGLDWDWQPNPVDSFSTSVSRQDTIPFNDEFESQRGFRYAEMVSYRRSLNPFTAAGVLGSASQSFYRDRNRPDVHIYRINGFLGVRLTPLLTSDTSLGYSASTRTGGNLEKEDTSGALTALIGLNHEISETRRQRLAWQRSLSEAFAGGVDVSDAISYSLNWSDGFVPGSLSSRYFIADPQDDNRNGYRDWTTTLGVRYPLTRLIMLSLNGSYAMRMNDAADVIGDSPDLSSDYQTLTLSANTAFQFTRKTTLTGYFSHSERWSPNPDMEYTRDMIGMTLSWNHKF